MIFPEGALLSCSPCLKFKGGGGLVVVCPGDSWGFVQVCLPFCGLGHGGRGRKGCKEVQGVEGLRQGEKETRQFFVSAAGFTTRAVILASFVRTGGFDYRGCGGVDQAFGL